MERLIVGLKDGQKMKIKLIIKLYMLILYVLKMKDLQQLNL